MSFEQLLELTKQAVERFNLDPQQVSDTFMWAADQSQQPTAIPALVFIASFSLLVLVGWIAFIAIALISVKALAKRLRARASG